MPSGFNRQLFMTTRAFNGLTAVTIILVTCFVYRALFGMWFTDIDTFPLISSGMFSSWQEFKSIISEPLMQGLMVNALYFRPLSSISWGIDAAIWGLNPLGYHLTDLVLHIANSLLLHTLLRNTTSFVSGKGTQGQLDINHVAAALAALMFAIHPVAQEVVPAIARRADLLFAFFLLLTMHGVLHMLQNPSARSIVIANLLAALTFTTKEPALATPGFAMAFVLCFSSVPLFKERILQCLRLCWPMLLLALLYFAYRWQVLGGMGGYAEIEAWAHLPFSKGLTGSIRPVVCTLLLPGGLDACAAIPRIQSLLVVMVLAAAVALLVWQQHNRDAVYTRITAFFVLALGGGVIVLHALTGTPAYLRTLYVGLLFISMQSAWTMVMLINSLRDKTTAAIARGLHATGALVLSLAAASVVYGALHGQYINEWHELAEVSRPAVEDFDAGLADMQDNGAAYLVNVPYRRKPAWGGNTGWVNPYPMRERPMLLEHSFQGYADLAYPDKNIEVAGLTFIEMQTADPATIASRAAYEAASRRLTVQTDDDASPMREIWLISYPRPSVWRNIEYSGKRSERKIFVDLDPEADLETYAAFFVFAGDRAVKKDTSDWAIDYQPAPATR